MPDDMVTIDPQFQPSRPGDGQGRGLRLAGIGAAVVVAFLLGWLLKTPVPNEPGLPEAVSTSTQPPIDETTTSTLRSRPPATTTTTAEPVALAVPLGEAVPGFTDTISMLRWGENRIEILRWASSQSSPETVASLAAESMFFGLDASGRWVAGIDDGVLYVEPVRGSSVDGPWPEGFDGAIDVRVASAVWHESDPAQLAWVKCSLDRGATDEGPRRIATLHSVDLESGTDEAPDAKATIDGGCVSGWGISPHLFHWGNGGIRYWSEADGGHEYLIQPNGATVVAPANAETIVAPNGWAVVMDHGYRDESHLMSPDGTAHPVPGLAEGESVDSALWSPDSSRLAYGVPSGNGEALIRIVEMASGVVDAEVTAPNHELWPVTWSTDSRFLLLEQWPVERSDNGKLMFHNVGAGTSVTVPLPPEIGDIRTFEPVPVAEQFAPVEWGIVPDDESWGPGVYTVYMELDARPLLRDQVEDVSGQLIWDETVVDLCNVGMDWGDGFLNVGDTFETIEGCGANPTAMQDAFDEFGIPKTACLTVTAEGVEHEYCAPLN